MRPPSSKYLEWACGTLTLIPPLLGTTTPAGAALYAVVCALWWVWTVQSRTWGFLPLQVGGTAVSIINLWRCFA